MMALCNDFHFWGLEAEPSCRDDGADDQDVGQYPCGDRLEDVWHDDSVSRQLGLIECLQRWNPWELPTQELIDKFQMISNVGPLANGAAVFKARQFAMYQLAREQSAYEEHGHEGLRASFHGHVLES